jgi:hypothetical protein
MFPNHLQKSSMLDLLADSCTSWCQSPELEADDIFAKSLYTLCGYGAKIILYYIKEQILVKAVALSLVSEISEQDIVNPDIGGDILNKISYSEVIEHKQVCILYLFMKMKMLSIKY